MRHIILPFLTAALSLIMINGTLAQGQTTHAIAMHGAVKYPADFTHFDYVNPQAPKGGKLRLATTGSFDTLNPFTVKGVPASSLGLTYATLMVPSADEPFTKYGGLAKEIITPEDRSSLEISLHDNAVFHDGTAITSADVVWSFKTLIKDGSPFYAAYYGDVSDVSAIGAHRVKFTFKNAQNRELPLILGQLPILPKHYWQDRDFTKTTIEPPIGSGPYKIATVDTGRSITYQRVENWWGENLPAYKGQYNFDQISVDYYRDPTVMLEGFMAGEYDFHQEYTAKTWATAYDNDAVKTGKIIKETMAHKQPAGMQAFIMNTRRDIFKDREVRRALQYVFDFEWSNKQFAYGSYTRTDSYFENSELASQGLPDEAELAILMPFKQQLHPDVFTNAFSVPTTKGDGRNRRNLKIASDILDAAGYQMGPDNIRVHQQTGQRLRFEIIDNQAAFERWVLPMIKNMKKIGIEATFRVVDNAQLVNRLNDFNFDMTIHSFGQSNSPGNEQREFWGSEKAEMQGSRNLIGIQDPVIDQLIEGVISAPDRTALVTRTRALDRVLLNGHYVIPQWHINAWRLAYWDKFNRPANPSDQVMNAITTWWSKTQ